MILISIFPFQISVSKEQTSMYWNHSEITQIHNYEYSRFKQRFVMTGGVPLSCPAPSLACPGTPWTGRAGWRCSGTWRGWAAAGWWSHCTPGYRSPPSYPCTGHSSGLHRGGKTWVYINTVQNNITQKWNLTKVHEGTDRSMSLTIRILIELTILNKGIHSLIVLNNETKKTW